MIAWVEVDGGGGPRTVLGRPCMLPLAAVDGFRWAGLDWLALDGLFAGEAASAIRAAVARVHEALAVVAMPLSGKAVVWFEDVAGLAEECERHPGARFRVVP